MYQAPEKKASPFEIIGAWLHIWTPPRGVEIPPVPWHKLAIGTGIGALIVGIALAIMVPRIDANKLSPQLGDLSDVRVHTGDYANDLNHAVSAKAFATGTDVYFGKDQYKPGSSDGDKLIAHELAHVVQQRGAPTSGPLTVSNPGDAMENEADAVADKVQQ